jgi:hypothetical protein
MSPPLAPHRALLHPLWLSALAVLVLNDHVLKGSGLLPPLVTGKLSDFAGLLVAPALLAALVGVRSSRGWWLAHAAVATVFSAIQLSPAAAGLWSRAMAELGAPWVTVCDPSDLVALPMLLLSGRAFARAMERPLASTLRRSGEWTAAGVGLACCMATSPPHEMWFADILADVYLHNGSDRDLVVRIRPVSPSIDHDCDAIATDPGRLLRSSIFGPGDAWSLRPGANMALLEHAGERECHAAWVDVDGFAPVVVFWRDGRPERRWIPGEGLDGPPAGRVVLDLDAQGRGTWDAEHGLVHVRTEGGEEIEPSCLPPSGATRLDWSTTPIGHWTLAGVADGLDGCLDLTLASGSDPEQEGEHRRWYLCVPLDLFPFEAGDAIDIAPMHEALGGWIDGVRMREVDPREPSSRQIERELVVSRGNGLPTIFGLEATFGPDGGCPWVADHACGTVTREGSLAVSTPSSGVLRLRAADGPRSIDLGDGRHVDLMVAHASERALLDPECALGSDSLGPDMEIVAALRGDQEE